MRKSSRFLLIAFVGLMASCTDSVSTIAPQPATTIAAFASLVAIVTSSPTIPATAKPTIWATPSPFPPLPVFATPDVIHLMHWKEYEKALARVIKRSTSPEKKVLCEWITLGSSTDAVYVWALCAERERDDFYPGVSTPAVIYIDSAGKIVEIIAPEIEGIPIREVFPENVAEIIFAAHGGPGAPGWLDSAFKQLEAHLIYRFDHPEVPPLVVLSATPAP